MPKGDDALVGDEATRLKGFKNALNMEDRDAADVFLEIGRRIFRQRMEVGSRDQESEERKSFQKLVFVSQQLFGPEKSRFLLPWKRVFGVTDGQLNVALRDNAAKLYKEKVEAVLANNSLDVNALETLRADQVALGYADDVSIRRSFGQLKC
jgi:hypothetical protein